MQRAQRIGVESALPPCWGGWIRDLQGGYDLAFYFAAGLCVIAALLCLSVRRVTTGEPVER